MSIKFIKENEQLLMIYSPDFNGENIRLRIDKGEPFSIKNGCFRLNENQNHDFEIIKRQHKNIVDFMTYDDLVKRLENIVAGIEKVNC